MDIKHESALIRNKILSISYHTGMGHIGTALSSVEILNSIYHISDVEAIVQQKEDRNRIILSKGHGVVALYACLRHYGIVSEDEIALINQNGSLLGGHPPVGVIGIEHPTGALGHGASVGLGMAYGMKLKKMKSKVYVIIGDGELHEGSNWEAFMQASTLKLDNLFFIIDKNGLSGINETSCCELGDLEAKMRAFGMETYVVDGHDENSIEKVIKCKVNGPVCIICNTVKGKGVSFMENDNTWHYRPLNEETYLQAIREVSADED